MKSLGQKIIPGVLVGLLLAPGTGRAFRLIQAQAVDGTYCAGLPVACGAAVTFTRWLDYPVPFWINQDAAADAADPGLTQANIISAAQAAYQAWEDVPFSIITFKYAGETPRRVDPLDHDQGGANTTSWFRAGDFDCAGAMGIAGGVLAVTILTEVAASGEITDADVQFDSADTWVWSTACAAGTFDVQTVLTHEYGHSIGIHHTELAAGAIATRPTMFASYFCDAGVASGRTLEPDDQAAAQCLYPELPTVLLIDQTGSMTAGSRMADAKAAAHAFVDAYADNVLAIAAFADAPAGICPGGAARPGYELKQDWTDDVALLHAAIDPLSACGSTPLWESTCCAITKAVENQPSNLLVFTDTEENNSGVAPNCGPCVTFANVLAAALGTSVVVYVIDMTVYFAAEGSGPQVAGTDERRLEIQSDSDSLQILARRTGGLYFSVQNRTQLLQARIAIQRHIAQFGKARQRPPTCNPGQFPIDVVQKYSPGCTSPLSPYAGQQITVSGRVTVKRGTYDLGTQYVQDCSGGIQVFDTAVPAGEIGDSVRVTGTVGSSLGEIRISNVVRYEVLQFPRSPLLAPIIDPFDCSRIDCCEWIGSLWTFRGFAAAPVSNFRFPLVSQFGHGNPQSITIFLDPDTGIDPGIIRAGDYYEITGIYSRRSGSNELKPRSPADVFRGVLDVDPGPGPARITGIQAVRPNPFNGETVIAYSLAMDGPVSLRIHDVSGRLVRVLVDGALSRNHYLARWDGTDDHGTPSPRGVYFARLRGPDGTTATRSVVLLR